MDLFYTYIAYFNDDTFQSVGVTTDLNRRFKLLKQIRNKKGKNCCKLVYYEEFKSSVDAINCENKLNELSEKSRKQLVENTNPMFVNLLDNLHEFEQ